MLKFLRRFALAGTAFLVLVFGLLAWDYTVDRAEVQAQENAALIAEYMQRFVQTQDVMLTAADEALSRFEPDREYERSAHLFLQRLSDRIEGSVGIAFVRSDGAFEVSSFAFPSTGSVGERAYLRETPAGGTFIDRIVTQPQGVDALVVSRRPAGEAGANGVWVSAVDIQVMREFLQRIAAREGEAASVIRDDGVLLARNRTMHGPMALPEDQPMAQAIQDGGGVFRAQAVTDGTTRIYATRKVAGLPLYATFGISLWMVFRDWALATGAAALLFGTIGGAAYLMANSAARRMRAEAAQAASAFDRRLLEEAKKTAALRETMLRELNHRVKNSLGMISALIRLQRGRPNGPDLEEVVARVQAIAAIHDLLYHSAGDFDVDFAELLHRIAESEAVAPPEGPIRVVVDTEPIGLDVGVATPLALCAVELITNASKHAYDGGGGDVTVRLERLDPDRGLLSVSDGGRGLPEGPGRRSGLRVVEELVRQVGGEMTVENRKGAQFEIVFPAVRAEDRVAAALAAS
jgi:two-component sensor histidine kinase